MNELGRKQRLKVNPNQDDCLRQGDQPGDRVIVDLPGQVLVALARWGGLPISLHICAAWLGHTQAVADIHYRMTGTSHRDMNLPFGSSPPPFVATAIISLECLFRLA